MKSEGNNGLPFGEEFESVVTQGEAAGVLATSLPLDGEEIENAASKFESCCCKSNAGRSQLHEIT